MDIPEINEENIELLEDRKFLKLYAYHYAGGDYVVASRHDREGLAVLHQDSDFPDAVSCIVIFTDEKGEGRLYLQKEFRYPLGRFVLSPPAGLIDPEDGKNADAVLTAAKREIFEETGLELTGNDRVFTVLPGAFSSAGMTDESNAFVCAVTAKADLSGMNQEGGVGGECFDGFRLYTEEEARALLKEGRDEERSICPAQTWLAVLYFISGLWKE